MLLALGCDIRTIQEYMGHSQLSATELYTHVYEGKKNIAVASLSEKLIESDDKTEE